MGYSTDTLNRHREIDPKRKASFFVATISRVSLLMIHYLFLLFLLFKKEILSLYIVDRFLSHQKQEVKQKDTY